MRIAKHLRIGAVVFVTWTVAISLVGLAFQRLAGGTKTIPLGRVAITLALSSAAMAVTLTTILALNEALDASAPPGANRAEVRANGLRFGVASTLFVCAVSVLFSWWSEGRSFSWDSTTSLLYVVAGLGFSTWLTVRKRERQLLKVRPVSLASGEMQLRTSFARGRLGLRKLGSAALTLTDQRLSIHDLDQPLHTPEDIPLAEIRSAATRWSRGVRQSLVLETPRGRGEFLVPNPESWVDALESARAHAAT